jgi:hypothetical protein
MRPRTLAILSLLVLGLAAFVWFYERDLPGTDERAEQGKKLLGGLQPEAVVALTLTQDGQEVRLEKEEPAAAETGGDGAAEDPLPGEEQWWLRAPLEARADREAVSQLLGVLTRLEKRRTLEDLSRQEAGLDPLQATLTLETAQGKRVVEVGGEVAVAGDRMVAVAGERGIHVVTGAFWTDLDKEPGDWRSRQVLPFDRTAVDRLVIGDGPAAVVLVREDGQSFRLEAPLADQADAQQVSRLLDELSAARVAEFVDDPAAEGVEPGETAAVFTSASGPRSHRLELLGLVGDDGRRYGRADGQLFVVSPGTLLDLAALPAEEWRSRAWTGLQIFDLQRLDVRGPGTELALTRGEVNWQRGDEEILYAPVRELLLLLTAVRGEETLPVAEARARGWLAGEGRWTFELVPEGEGRPAETVTVYPPGEHGVVAELAGRQVVVRTPAATLEELEKAVQAVRDAEPVAAGEGGADPALDLEGLGLDGLGLDD